MLFLISNLLSKINESLKDKEIFVDSINYYKKGKYNFLEIILDKVGGIDLDGIVEATNIVNPIVDKENITDDLVGDPFYSESNISYLEQKMDEYKKGELKFEKHEIDCSDESVDQTVKEKNTDESISHNYAEILKKEALDVKDKVENGTAPVFDNIDLLVMLKVPSFEKVYEWRKLQEDKLRKTTLKVENSRIMTDSELDRFISHYERLTRFILSEMPQRADMLFHISNDHSICI